MKATEAKEFVISRIVAEARSQAFPYLKRNGKCSTGARFTRLPTSKI